MPSQATLRKHFTYDPKTGALVKTNGKCGYIATTGYRHIYFHGRTWLAHRLIWKWMTGKDPPIIDHINRIRIDNRWSNLRIVDSTQNTHNRSLSTRNTTGVKGVIFIPARKRYRAQLAAHGRIIWFKHFRTLEEAAEAVQTERIKRHGDYACH